MRKFLSSTAGATFYEGESNFTVNVRKDTIELIVKINRGVYGIVNLNQGPEGKLILMASWGKYFQRFQNPSVQLPKIEKTCPKLYQLLTMGYKDMNMIESYLSEGMGIAMLVDDNGSPNLLCNITDDLVDKVFDMVNALVEIVTEISKNPPFPAWKDGLGEVWN